MRIHFGVALVCALLFTTPIRAQDAIRPRNDSHGDPLPDGAVARLGTLRFKHVSPIQKASYSPDGQRIGSLAASGLRIWNAETGKEWAGPWSVATVNSFAFSPAGAVVATASNSVDNGARKGDITLWDIEKVKKLIAIEIASPIRTLTFADGGKTFIWADEAGIVRWLDVESGKERRTWKLELENHKPGFAGPSLHTYSYVLSPDGKFLSLGVNPGSKGAEPDTDCQVLVFDLTTEKQLWRAQGKRSVTQGGASIFSSARAVFSADGKRLALLFGRDQLELRNTITGKLIAKPPWDGQRTDANVIGDLAISGDGKMLALADSELGIVFWNAEEPGSLRTAGHQTSHAPLAYRRDMALSPDGNKLLVAIDGVLQLHDTATFNELRLWDGHRSGVDYMAFASDGKHLTTCGGESQRLDASEAITWDLARWKQIKLSSLHAPLWPNIGVASPEHTTYAGKEGPGRFQLYDMATGKSLGRLNIPDSQSVVLGFFSPRGKYFVCYAMDAQGKDVMRLYSVPSGQFLCQTPTMAGANVYHRSENSIYRHDARVIAFSDDGRFLAHLSREDARINVVEIATGRIVQRLGDARPEILKNGMLDYDTKLSFSPDGKLLAITSSEDNIVRIWDVATGRVRIRLLHNGLPDWPGAFAWSPDGRMLATSGLVEKGKIQLWELASGAVRREWSGHEMEVRSLAFSPDGRLLASGSGDTTVLVWDVMNTLTGKREVR